MSFTKHKNKIIYESFTGQNHSQFKRVTEKSMKITNKISWVRLFNRAFGFIFMLFETNFIFMLFETNFIFMLFETNFVFMLFALMLFGT